MERDTSIEGDGASDRETGGCCIDLKLHSWHVIDKDGIVVNAFCSFKTAASSVLLNQRLGMRIKDNASGQIWNYVDALREARAKRYMV